MIIHNTTFSILPEIQEAFQSWIKTNHVPQIEALAGVTKVSFLKLLTEVNTDGITYTVQIEFNQLDPYETFLRTHNDIFMQLLLNQFPKQFLTFETTLRVL